MERYIEKTDKEPFMKREVDVYFKGDKVNIFYSPTPIIEDGNCLVVYSLTDFNSPANNIQYISVDLLNKYYNKK